MSKYQNFHHLVPESRNFGSFSGPFSPSVALRAARGGVLNLGGVIVGFLLGQPEIFRGGLIGGGLSSTVDGPHSPGIHQGGGWWEVQSTVRKQPGSHRSGIALHQSHEEWECGTGAQDTSWHSD